ncbi:hypothetical protein SAMN03159339_0538 [Variovorax sp. 770b2]|nr:hypothetical protein SAMN03159339_0538 [Variovorax sp. 770b2]
MFRLLITTVLMNHPRSFSTPLLRQLASTGKAGKLIAREDAEGFVLVMKEGTSEQVLAAQRGGRRYFKRLDALASYLAGLGLRRFVVELENRNR